MTENAPEAVIYESILAFEKANKKVISYKKKPEL